MLPQPSLLTERLALRPCRERDVPALVALAGDLRIAATTGTVPHPYTPAAAHGWLASHAPAWIADSQIHFAIVDRSLDELRGVISLRREGEGIANVGYWIGVPYWGQGLATEACATLVAFGFDHWALRAINGRHLPENPASGRVLLKNGFIRQGRVRALFPLRGGEEELDSYQLTRELWLTRLLD